MTKTAKELQKEGLLYDVFDKELAAIKDRTYGLVNELSHVSALDKESALHLVHKIVGNLGEESYVVPPFRCDYGPNITIGAHCFINYNCCFLDSAEITIGDYVFIGANTCILSGVTIGSRVLIGAGSVVSRDIPDDVLALGNPCRVKRPITAADKDKYLVPPK